MSLENLINEVLRIKGINEQLLDTSYNLLFRLIKKSKENNIPIDVETIALITEVRKTLGEIHNPIKNHPFSPTDFQQRNKTPDDETEPKNAIESDILHIRFILPR
jgi:hypothetical protein